MPTLTTSEHLRRALRALDELDDEITEMYGEQNTCDRRRLAKIRRAKDHIRKAAPPDADLGIHVNPNAQAIAKKIGQYIDRPDHAVQQWQIDGIARIISEAN